ncbi:hypothetical protein YQE_06135, partial [Dendroctonus ponderosae]
MSHKTAPKKVQDSKKSALAKDAKLVEDDSERKFRTLSILSYFIVLVLLGIPIWWYTTRVYRAPLPLEDIDELRIKATKASDFGIPLSLEYDILITFVHPDPESIKIQADGSEIETLLQDLLKKLSPISEFVVKSQWLYLIELAAIPRMVMDFNLILKNQLPHVITPLETKLWSHASPRPTINLIVYFPHCHTAPLHIADSDNNISPTNAFVSPRWGGIYLVNLDESSCNSGHFAADSKEIALNFHQMLLELFHLNNTSEAVLTEFKLKKIEEMLESSKRTLKSLAQLLSEINSIVISDQVASQINLALHSVQEAETLLATGDKEGALQYAKLAFKNSEEAFAHPSLLALLYFPDDQKCVCHLHSAVSACDDSCYYVFDSNKEKT